MRNREIGPGKEVLEPFLSLENFEKETEGKPLEALQYVDEYVEKHVNQSNISERERLMNLDKFVEKEKIEQKIAELNNPDWKEKMKRGISRERRRETREHRERLKKARESFEQSGDTGTDEAETAEAAQILWVEEHQRMHGDRGYYYYAYDQFGNTFFQGPDLKSKNYANLLSPYFNVNRYELIQLPDGDTNHMIRFLAERSRTVDSSAIAAEDCQKIDPLPVTDPDRSYVSCMLVNIMGGAGDTIVKRYENSDGTISSEKNQAVRKDGVFYLFDLDDSMVPDEARMRDQFGLLQDLLLGINDNIRKDMINYIAQTVLFVGCLARTKADDQAFYVPDVCKKFPARFERFVTDSEMQADVKTAILDALKDEYQRFKEIEIAE